MVLNNMKSKCCVPHCESRRNNVILHRFPKSEVGLYKWVQKCFKSGDLNKFSSEELRKMFVCHKHFEKRFVTDKSRLRQSSYPTLFSLEEIDSGIPITEQNDNENVNFSLDHSYTCRVHYDHSYCKQRSPLKELETQNKTLIYHNEPSTYSKPVIEGADDECDNDNVLTDHNEPSTSSKPIIEGADDECDDDNVLTDHNEPSTSSKPVIEGADDECDDDNVLTDYNELSTSSKPDIEGADDECRHNVLTDHNHEPSTSSIPVIEGADDECKHDSFTETRVPYIKTVKVSRRPYINKRKLNPASLKLLAEYKKTKRQLHFLTRAKKAMKLTKMESFEKLTAGVHPLAKKILWMQISQATKETKGRRFSDVEKLTALAIMEQGLRTYKFLRRIFILPSVKTINKMQKIKS